MAYGTKRRFSGMIFVGRTAVGRSGDTSVTGFILRQTRHAAQSVDDGRRNLVMGTHHQKCKPVIVADILGFFVDRRLGFEHGQFLVQGLRVFEAAPLLANDVQGDTLKRVLI